MRGSYRLSALGAALAFVLLLATPAAALKLLPFKAAIVVSPSSAAAKGGAVQVFRLENNTNGAVAVEVYAETWDVDADGVETNQPAKNLFSIFPAQLVVPPRESRAVRVVWLGEAPAREKAFRLVAAQLPVDLKDAAADGAAVRFLLRFKAALYIRPAQDVKSDIRAETAEILPDGRLRLMLHNRGNAHALLRRPRLTLVLATGQQVTLPESALKPLEGENIHAGAQRLFTLAGLPSLPQGAAVARAEFAYDGMF